MKLTIPSTVIAIEEKFQRQYLSGVGSEATFTSVSIGWYGWFKGSHESLFLGMDKPLLAPGDQINITIEKAHARPDDPTRSNSNDAALLPRDTGPTSTGR